MSGIAAFFKPVPKAVVVTLKRKVGRPSKKAVEAEDAAQRADEEAARALKEKAEDEENKALEVFCAQVEAV